MLQALDDVWRKKAFASFYAYSGGYMLDNDDSPSLLKYIGNLLFHKRLLPCLIAYRSASLR